MSTKVIVEPCEVAFPCTALVVRLNNALFVTLPVVCDDAAVVILLAEQVLCILFDLRPLHYNSVMGIRKTLYSLCQ